MSQRRRSDEAGPTPPILPSGWVVTAQPWSAVPKQLQSGEMNRLGHITHRGPGLLRSLLVESAWCVWQGIRRSPTTRAFYERVTHKDPDRKKIAIVATAHYMTRVAVSMLKSGQVWKEDSRLDHEADETKQSTGALPQTPPRKPLPPEGE